MDLYRWEQDRFRQLREGAFAAETDLERLLEQDPTILLREERLLVIGRQAHVDTIRRADLLALDQNGSAVIIELKRGKLPRKAVAQILEYAAEVSRLNYEDLDALCRRWFHQQGREYSSLLQTHRDFFEYEPGFLNELDFNRHQRLVLVAEGADERVLNVAAYLRSYGLDIAYISYRSYGQAPEEVLVSAETLLGHVLRETRKHERERSPRMTRSGFLQTLSANAELFRVAENFLQYLDSSGANLRRRVGRLRATVAGNWWIDTYPARRATHFRVMVHADFTNDQVQESYPRFSQFTRTDTGIAFNITAAADLLNAEDLFEFARVSLLEAE